MARIEEKLNEMVSILKTQSRSKAQDIDLTNADSEVEDSEPRDPISLAGPNSLTSAVLGPAHADDESHGDWVSNTLSTINATPISVFSYDDESPLSEAEEMLKRFRDERIVSFPPPLDLLHLRNRHCRQMSKGLQ